jgi:hypothetical protein
MPGKINLSDNPAPRLKNKTRLAARLSGLLDMPPCKSNEFVLSLESDPIFVKLRRAGILKRALPCPARYRMIPLTEIASIGSGVPGFAELLKKHGDAVKVIRMIGQNNFRDFFLLDAPPTGPLRRTEVLVESQILIRPNILF